MRISRLSVEKFCLTVAKAYVGETFIVALNLGTGKVWRRGGGEYQNFPSSFFCLRVPKNTIGESFTVALIAVT